MVNFAHQNLRDRSFAGQNLKGANFRSADLRGCNFRGADLAGADFTNAQIGFSWSRGLMLLTIALVVGAGSGGMLSYLIFGVLGQTPGDRAWPYVIAFYGLLSLTGLLTLLSLHFRAKLWLSRFLFTLVGVCICTLTGFFYGGQLGGSLSPTGARWGAVAGVGVGLSLGSCSHLVFVQIGLLTGAMLQVYTLFILVGTQTLALLQVQRWAEALEWGIGLTIAGLCTWQIGLQTIDLIVRSACTCFERATLTDVVGLWQHDRP